MLQNTWSEFLQQHQKMFCSIFDNRNAGREVIEQLSSDYARRHNMNYPTFNRDYTSNISFLNSNVML